MSRKNKYRQEGIRRMEKFRASLTADETATLDTVVADAVAAIDAYARREAYVDTTIPVYVDAHRLRWCLCNEYRIRREIDERLEASAPLQHLLLCDMYIDGGMGHARIKEKRADYVSCMHGYRHPGGKENAYVLATLVEEEDAGKEDNVKERI
jgi:hypothetical protein